MTSTDRVVSQFLRAVLLQMKALEMDFVPQLMTPQKQPVPGPIPAVENN